MPVVFFKDVSFSEIESLVEYIYTGEVEVAGSSLQSFLSLADSLGVSGFTHRTDKTPTKRKLEWGTDGIRPMMAAAGDEARTTVGGGCDSSGGMPPPPPLTTDPWTPSKSKSEPASLLDTVLQGSNTKKRKLQTQSLTEEVENIDPNLLNLRRPAAAENRSDDRRRSACSRIIGGGLSQRASSFLRAPPSPRSPHHPPSPSPLLHPHHPPSPMLHANHRLQRTDSNATVRIKPSPQKDRPSHHAPSSSCPVPPSPNNSSTSAKQLSTTTTTGGASNPSNFSFDSHFLDPDELAAKGATLLHHLAVWMIQQRKDSQNQHLYQG